MVAINKCAESDNWNVELTGGISVTVWDDLSNLTVWDDHIVIDTIWDFKQLSDWTEDCQG